MAERITSKWLSQRLEIAVSILQRQGLPVHQNYAPDFKAGCLMLDHCAYGWELQMTHRDGCSGVINLSGRMTAKEMDSFLAGIIATDQIAYRLQRQPQCAS